MARLLSISKAARLIGVKRKVLQKKIQDGELVTFEGMIDIDNLLQVYPQTKLYDDSMLEKVEHIMATAMRKVVSQHSSDVNTELLATRVRILNNELMQAKEIIGQYSTLIQKVESKLTQLSAENNELLQLKSWFKELLQENHAVNTKDETTSPRIKPFAANHIRLLPSTRDYFSEGNETLLESGLRAGLALNYGCSNGNCGLCKAKLLMGTVEQSRFYDYVFSEAEKQAGYLLMCSNKATSDVVLEANEADSAADIPYQEIDTRIKKMEQINPHLLILHLKTPRTQRLRFLAGQYVNLSVKGQINSDYALASCPCDDMNIQFHITKEAGNAFSQYAFYKLKHNETITIKGPQGNFLLDESASKELVFIAWDTSFSAIKSLIQHAMSLEIADKIYFYWLTSCDEVPYLDNLCRSWMDAFDNFFYQHVSPYVEHQTERKYCYTRAMEELAKQLTKDALPLADMEFYISAPEPILSDIEEFVEAHHVPRASIHLDTFLHDI